MASILHTLLIMKQYDRAAEEGIFLARRRGRVVVSAKAKEHELKDLLRTSATSGRAGYWTLENYFAQSI